MRCQEEKLLLEKEINAYLDYYHDIVGKLNENMESWSKSKSQFVGFLEQNYLMPVLRNDTDMSKRK